MSKILFVTDYLPSSNFSGSGVTSSAAIHALLKKGHTVHILALSCNAYESKVVDSNLIEAWDLLGVKSSILNFDKLIANNFSGLKGLINKLAIIIWPEKYLPLGVIAKKNINDFIRHISPDKVVAYHWNAGLAIKSIDVKRYLVVGDPLHLPILYGSKLLVDDKKQLMRFYVKEAINYLLSKRLIKLMSEIMNAVNACGAFAAHHADKLSQSSISGCQYIHTPVADPSPNQVGCENKSQVLKILHIGHLQGTATIAGIQLIGDEVIPVLNKSNLDYEMHFVGAFSERLPEIIKKKLGGDHIKFKGEIYPPDTEFTSSHCLLVATPIELGIRVRIITAFSFGSCIVAHGANAKGIPELVHGFNCMLGNSGAELAEHCLEIFKNPLLRRRLQVNARNTFEQYFSAEVVGEELCELMEEYH